MRLSRIKNTTGADRVRVNLVRQRGDERGTWKRLISGIPQSILALHSVINRYPKVEARCAT